VIRVSETPNIVTAQNAALHVMSKARLARCRAGVGGKAF
jgi:hypothetical protein